MQVAAVPGQFEGAECLAGELFVAFTPGGFCDYTARGGVQGGQGCESPWDGVWLGRHSCTVERAHQSLTGADLALEIATQACTHMGSTGDSVPPAHTLPPPEARCTPPRAAPRGTLHPVARCTPRCASQGCVLTKDENSAPFLYRSVGDGTDFIATVQVRDSSNVQFSGGGLLLTAAEDGSRSWVALRMVQVPTLYLAASPPLARLAHQPPASAPRPEVAAPCARGCGPMCQATSVAVSASSLDDDDYDAHPPDESAPPSDATALAPLASWRGSSTAPGCTLHSALCTLHSALCTRDDPLGRCSPRPSRRLRCGLEAVRSQRVCGYLSTPRSTLSPCQRRGCSLSARGACYTCGGVRPRGGRGRRCPRAVCGCRAHWRVRYASG